MYIFWRERPIFLALCSKRNIWRDIQLTQDIVHHNGQCHKRQFHRRARWLQTFLLIAPFVLSSVWQGGGMVWTSSSLFIVWGLFFKSSHLFLPDGKQCIPIAQLVTNHDLNLGLPASRSTVFLQHSEKFYESSDSFNVEGENSPDSCCKCWRLTQGCNHLVALTAEKARDILIHDVKFQSGPNSLRKWQETIANLFQAFQSFLYVWIRRLGQEDHGFEDSLEYVRLCQ